MKRFIAMILFFLLLTAGTGISCLCSAQEIAEPVQVHFSAAKDSYREGQQIKTHLKLENNHPYSIFNVHIQLDGPDGYTIYNSDVLPANLVLGSGKSASYSIVLTTGPAKVKTPTASILLAAAIITAGLAAVVIILIFIIKKTSPKKATVCLLLALTMLFGMCAMPLQVNADNMVRHRIRQTATVTIGQTEHTITATVSYDYIDGTGELLIDTTNLGYREDWDAFTVPLDFDGLYGKLNQPEGYSKILLSVYDASETLVWQQAIAPTKTWHFPQVGLCPGLNRVVIQAIGAVPLSAQLLLYDFYGQTYNLLEGADTDTDGDHLFDLIERNLKTDPTAPDTDGDGLSDYDEVCRLGTDPLQADSDGNAIPDSEEDRDGDGIPNKQELDKGLSPILTDTDRDSLSDADEQSTYRTNPLKADTDDDGAEDGWEIRNGYDPRRSNYSFKLSSETEKVSDTNPVSVKVELSVDGKQANVDSLAIEYVGAADSPYLTQSAAGYLGDFVDISLDGTFDSATLTFRYDTALGTPGRDFEPRICYLNEQTGELEVLENQTVRNGVVTAKTTHFSKYGLVDIFGLDKVLTTAYNNMMELYEAGQTNRENALAALATADIALVMDSSASIAWNDPAGKSWEAAEYFLSHIRPNYDQAAVLTYTATPTVLQPMTADIDILKQAVGRISIDNGVGSNSGTNGATALDSAMDMLCKSAGSYRYAVFFSDGDDPTLQDQYRSLVDRANKYGIRFICIGVGWGDHSLLEKLAADTGGEFFTINQSSRVETTFAGALDIFDAITPTDEDSNNDGISDFVTKLIYDGKIPLSNGSFDLAGADLNYNVYGDPSDDWDCDGIKNGKEIRLSVRDKKAYMAMTSNPLKFDSDRDGYTDKQEIDRGMDPMRSSLEKLPMDVILEGPYYHCAVVDNYDPDALPDGWGWLASVNTAMLYIDGFVFAGGEWNREEIYQELIAEYYYEHAQDAMGDVQDQRIISYLFTLLDLAKTKALDPKMKEVDQATNVTFVWDFLSDVHEAEFHLANPNLTKEQLEKLCQEDYMQGITNFLHGLEDKIPIKLKDKNVVTKLFSKVDDYTKNISELSDTLGKVGDVMTYVEAGVDLFETVTAFAKVEADCAVFLSNMDALEYIAKFSQDEYAAEAANMLIIQVTGDFADKTGVLMCNALRDAAQLGGEVLMDLAAKIPYVGTFVIIVKAVIDVVGWISGTEAEVEATYRILCYNEMATVYTKLLNGHCANHQTEKDLFFDEAGRELYRRYVLNLGKIRYLGEQQYIKYYDAKIIGGTKELEKEMRPTFNRLDNAMKAIRENTLYSERSHGGASVRRES